MKGLVNTVDLYKREISFNSVNEEVEAFPTATETDIAASVQDREPVLLTLPDMDGPVLINAVIFTEYRTDIAHLDRLKQTDADPERTYQVIFPDDAAGRHHHLELRCQRVLPAEEVPS